MVWAHVEQVRGELGLVTETTDFAADGECIAANVHAKCDTSQECVRLVRGNAGAAVEHQEALPGDRGGVPKQKKFDATSKVGSAQLLCFHGFVVRKLSVPVCVCVCACMCVCVLM